ncbi:MAG: ketopantoate reductase family protein [bacterium]
MKYLIVGTGALGSIFGGFLHLSGREVGFLGRGPHFEKIRKEGLLIRGIWGEHWVRNIRTFSSPRKITLPSEIVLMCVKSFDTEQAIKDVAPFMAQDGLVVSLQNGLGNLEKIAEQVGSERTIGGRVIFGVEIPRPGEARVTVYADKVLLGFMEGAGEPDEARTRIRAMADEFNQALIPTRAVEAITPFIWAKVLYNCALNPLAALLQVTYGELGSNQETRAVMREIVEETYQVAERLGIPLPQRTAQEYFNYLMNQLIPATASHHASMLQDLQQGRRTEIDALNGAVGRLAENLGLSVPANRLITRLIHFCESRPGSIRRDHEENRKEEKNQ